MTNFALSRWTVATDPPSGLKVPKRQRRLPTVLAAARGRAVPIRNATTTGPEDRKN
jgi:hypothetical protein